MDPHERQIRQRLKDDFPHYASKCLKIRTKNGAIVPFALNEAQRYIHDQLEFQVKRTGKVRALVLKGRQQGCSTYVEGRFFHKITHRYGARAFILTHEAEATKNIFELAKRYYKYCPAPVRPSVAASNAKELLFDKLDCEYRVGTAGTKDVGRSSTIQYFHGSEVAYWPNAETHALGVMQAVPDAFGTEIILESTSAGPKGYFYNQWKKAERGESEYIAIFTPWFWQPEYRKAIPSDKTIEWTNDELDYQRKYGLDDEQLYWRRLKIIELEGIWNFRREYPATPDEAFNADVPGALWTREQLEKLRVDEPPQYLLMAIAADPATTSKEESDETGIIWGGLAPDDKAYIQGDESGQDSPDTWARKIVNAFYRHNMEAIVYEANQGGDMVAHTIRTVDPTVPLLAVHAKKGKRARAEPVAALYAQDRVRHVGTLAGLEDQMCTWNAAASDHSPDRVDALVYLIHYLILGREEFVFV